jgi:hypothetical protein
LCWSFEGSHAKQLINGQFVDVEFSLPAQKQHLLPLVAVSNKGDDYFVYKVVEDDKGTTKNKKLDIH